MNFRQQVTSALAWAGLVIVIAVPCAEVISSKLLSSSTAPAPAAQPLAKVVYLRPQPGVAKTAAATVTVPAEPAKIAAAPIVQPEPVASTPPVVQPTVTIQEKPATTQVAEEPAPASSNTSPVQDYLATNKKLPSYITAAPLPADADAPMTPAAQRLAATLSSASSSASGPTAAPSASSIAIPAVAPAAAVDTAVASADGSAIVPVPVPRPVSLRPKRQPDQTVTEADLKDWKSGTLEDYLKSRGLLSPTSVNQGDGN